MLNKIMVYRMAVPAVFSFSMSCGKNNIEEEEFSTRGGPPAPTMIGYNEAEVFKAIRMLGEFLYSSEFWENVLKPKGIELMGKKIYSNLDPTIDETNFVEEVYKRDDIMLLQCLLDEKLIPIDLNQLVTKPVIFMGAALSNEHSPSDEQFLSSILDFKTVMPKALESAKNSNAKVKDVNVADMKVKANILHAFESGKDENGNKIYKISAKTYMSLKKVEPNAKNTEAEKVTHLYQFLKDVYIKKVGKTKKVINGSTAYLWKVATSENGNYEEEIQDALLAFDAKYDLKDSSKRTKLALHV